MMIRLSALYHHFVEAGDQEQADKMVRLIAKWRRQEFTVAMCGHFSAGKSSMINRMVGTEILPSSPIPTSANIVMIRHGEESAMAKMEDGWIALDMTQYSGDRTPWEELRSYFVDGKQVQSVILQAPSPFLPENVALMDTPGIDSTDDAHKMATESALFLADVLVYVMDYNHVQSEINFQFTKKVKEYGKPVYLVINQVDKHQDVELDFAVYRQSVADAFAAWGIEPDGIYFTSLKDENHPYNQYPQLQAQLRSIFQEKDERLPQSVLLSAQHLIAAHVEWLEGKQEQERENYEQVLRQVREEMGEESAGEQAGQYIRSRYESWSDQVGQLEEAPRSMEEEMERELHQILENAHLTPFDLREAAKAYLESRAPRFKVGFIFSATKTREEMERRLQVLSGQFRALITANLEWHVRELLMKIPEKYVFEWQDWREQMSSWQLELPEDLVEKKVNEAALAALSGTYVLQYCREIAEDVKTLCRRAAKTEIERAVERAREETAVKSENARQDLNRWEQAYEAWLGMERLQQDTAETGEGLHLLLSGDEDTPSSREVPDEVIDQVDPVRAEKIVKVAVTAEPFSDKEKTAAEAAASMDTEVTADEEQKNYKDLLNNVATRLKQGSALIKDVPGFAAVARGMEQRARRLEQNVFTVALFGAFSAGKSSFANAMLGERVLPVSPNPTTASINRILPPSPENPHGTVRVRLKTAQHMMEDIRQSLDVFGLKQEQHNGSVLDGLEKMLHQIDSASVVARARPHYVFLRAAARGYQQMKGDLGQERTVDLSAFAEYVAKEEMACFVEQIELYFDCPLTRQGITLVDTPGADSINARHTNLAFEYIKNADAVLFVTYYNHAFSHADREFLIQLGRVKDSFAMDKMFFLINAADLARTRDELEDVTRHVRDNLQSYGIRFPRLYPVSSQAALYARLKQQGTLPESADQTFTQLVAQLAAINGNRSGEQRSDSVLDVLKWSGLPQFEQDFRRFIMEELTGIAVRGAHDELAGARTQLERWLQTARQEEDVKIARRDQVQQQDRQVKDHLQSMTFTVEQRSLEQEIDELIFYVKKRVFERFGEWFHYAFNPSLFHEGHRSDKEALQTAVKELFRLMGYDLGQEMRATALRVEKFMHHKSEQLYHKMTGLVRSADPEFVALPYRSFNFSTPEFADGLQDVDPAEMKPALALFKNAKDFFEGKGKEKMRSELERLLDPLVSRYLEKQKVRMTEDYVEQMNTTLHEVRMEVQEQSDSWFAGVLAALSEQADLEQVTEVYQRLCKLI